MRGIAAAAALFAAGCTEDAPAPSRPTTAPSTVTATPTVTSTAGAPTAPPPSASPTCGAPSLRHDRPLDARTSAALARCERLRTGEGKRSLTCGAPPLRPVDHQRLRDAVPPVDDATRARIVETAKRGLAAGLDPRSFGLVGDSITVSDDFLRAFTEGGGRGPVALSDVAREALTLRRGGTVIDWYRGHVVERIDGRERDAFAAFRAARVGARAGWAVEGGASPVAELVRRVRPLVAIVTFGANDAAYRFAPPEELANELEANLLRVVRALELEGVVVVLSNEMRHLDQPGVAACPADDPIANDWRISVAQNATSARAAELACKEHLPFVDLRHALDGATNHGIGPDGVHLSNHPRGTGLLDDEGLDCGYNVRSFVTLRALAQVLDALDQANLLEGAR